MPEPTAYRWVQTSTSDSTQTSTQDAYRAACLALTHWRFEAKRLGALAGEKPKEMGECPLCRKQHEAE